MNNLRRRRLRVAQGYMANAKAILEEVLDEERNVYDHTPDSLQSTDMYSKVETAIDEIEEAISNLDDASEHLDRASE